MKNKKDKKISIEIIKIFEKHDVTFATMMLILQSIQHATLADMIQQKPNAKARIAVSLLNSNNLIYTDLKFPLLTIVAPE